MVALDTHPYRVADYSLTVRNPHHPTRERLIEVVVDLLAVKSPEDISVDEVLHASGISKGSLYHHFVDFSDLIDVALARQFAHYVDVNIDQLAALTTQVTTLDEFWAGIAAMSVQTQSPENRPNRYARLQVVARAARNEAFRQLLSEEQTRLTEALTDLFREGQIRGWLAKDFDPKAAAILIQAYTLGRSLDDVTDEPVDPQKWTDLIVRLVRRTFEVDDLN